MKEPEDKTYKSWWFKDEEQDKGNFSNEKYDTFMPDPNVLGVRLQQGVPLLDRDWNELEDRRRYAEVTRFANFIGNGVPDEKGFKIEPIAGSNDNFTIAQGLCLVDGFLVENGIEVTYLGQPVKPENPKKFGDGIDYIVYLKVWVLMVTKKEESWLNNPQDVNMETCVRHQLAWQVTIDPPAGTTVDGKPTYDHYYALAKITGNGNGLTVTDLRTTNLKLETLVRTINVELNAEGKPPDHFIQISKTPKMGIGGEPPRDNSQYLIKINGQVEQDIAQSKAFEDYFTGQDTLAEGTKTITFSGDIIGMISHRDHYKVLVTPHSECNGLYVSGKTAEGFTVKELLNGKNNTPFEWLVIPGKANTIPGDHPVTPGNKNPGDREMPGGLPHIHTTDEKKRQIKKITKKNKEE